MTISATNIATPKDILIVDDEPMVREFLAKVLTRNGFSCRTASDAGEAMASAMDKTPSLVVTDIRMPGRDGSWLLSNLRNRWPSTPVIVLTAVSDAKDAVECLKAGAQDYLLKPIDIQELLTSVRRGIEAAGPAANGAPETRQEDSRLQEALTSMQAALKDALTPRALPEVSKPGRSGRAAAELDILHKLASASRHSLDLEQVVEPLMNSLHHVLDYHAAALLLLEEEPSFTIYSRFPADKEFSEKVRSQVANNLKLTRGIDFPSSTMVRTVETPCPCEGSAPRKLLSFVNVPLIVRGVVVGLIHASSGEDQAFGEEEVLFMHRAADFLSSSVQGVRELQAAVKGRIERMVDPMTDGVLMLDAKGKVVAINGAARSLLECGEETPEPEKLSEMLQDDPVSRMRSERRAVKELVYFNGTVYQMRMAPVEDENGDFAGMVIAFRDFEEERKADEMTTELVGVVSHELRTPLTAISNALSLVGGGQLGSLSPRQDRFIELAKRNVEQLIRIINDFVDLSRIEARRMRLDLVPTALRDQVENAVASLQPQLEAKGVALQREIPFDLPNVFAHGPSIHRVVVNLVGNAIKFTDCGGLVKVEMARANHDEVAGRAGAIRVTVSDTGIGIPKGDLDVIFEKFHRIEGERLPGTGLGLSISRELVKAHHGRIWAESQKGCGSSFSFVLPILSEEELLVRALSLEITRASELQTPMALVVGRLQGLDELRARGEDEYRVAMDAISALSRKLIRRFSDLVLVRRDTGEVVIILPRTPRDGGIAFAARLTEAMRRELAHRPDLTLNLAAAQYPEDGLSAGELYGAALEGIREIVVA